MVVVAQGQAQQLPAPDSGGKQEHDRQSNQLGAKGRGRPSPQPCGGSQQFNNLLFREDVGLEPLMRLRKQGAIRNEALGLGPAAIEAEVVNLEHSVTSLTGSEMLLGPAPSLECSRIQVGVLGGLVAEKSVQRFEGASGVAET